MVSATYQRGNFLGGEVSQLAQGRIDREQYVTCMNVCFNGHPLETGAWVRRPGTMHAFITKGGAAGRVLKFDFNGASPYTTEWTNGFLRFRFGTALATTNDRQTIAAISAADPAVIQTAAAHGWSSGNTILPSAGATSIPLLDNRQFTITVVDSTHFSLQDAVTGANIDGSTLGSFLSGTVSRVQELATPYTVGSWASIRLIQAETTAVILAPQQLPQILSVTTLPGPGVDAQFSLVPLVFQDGPYLDPPTNGAQVVPGGVSGVVTLTLQFPLYNSATSYPKGAFVRDATPVNYVSLVDQNVGNTPASSPSDWAPTSAGAAINNGQGWLGTDIGRLVRLFSEPALWASGTTYAQNAIVSYNPSGLPGGSTYWQALVGSNTGNVPGNDTAHWSLLATNQAVIWSWGKIVSFANQISQTVSGVSNIGNMASNGGLAASFDGITSQALSACSVLSAGGTLTAFGYVGRHFGGGAQAIGSVTVYPSNDQGFGETSFGQVIANVVINLYAKNTLPASPTDGTLIGTSGPITNRLTAVTVQSNSVASWNYVWVEIVVTYSSIGFSGAFVCCAELQLFNPPGTGGGSTVNLEILGPALLYTNACITWRLGAYSGTTGYPTCGCYHEGRLWLAGAIANRFDASVSNGFNGANINFAPTDQYGTVGAANGISETFNSKGVNQIQWMKPDLQGIVCGTLSGMWLIEPLAQGAMAPNNIQGRPIPKIGSANIEPVDTEHTLIFVHRWQRKLMEGFADVYSGKITAPHLSRWATHMTKPLVAELAYTDAVTPMIWGRCNDGSWFGVTYKRDVLNTAAEPTYAGFHRHTLGSGRTVVSIAGGPSVGGTRDALSMVTLDPVSGVYHVEIMTDVLDEGSTLLEASYLDDAIAPSSTVSSSVPVVGAPYGGLTLNGLWHLNGKTVVAWLAGLDCGDYVVGNGSIFVPYGDGISAGTGSGLFTAAYYAANPTALVGFDFNSDGQPVRPGAPAESGARNGPALGKIGRDHYIFALLEGTQGISFGGLLDSTLKPAIFKQPNGTPYLLNQQFTGIFRDQFSSDYGFGPMVAWRVNRGYIANIAAIGPATATQDI